MSEEKKVLLVTGGDESLRALVQRAKLEQKLMEIGYQVQYVNVGTIGHSDIGWESFDEMVFDEMTTLPKQFLLPAEPFQKVKKNNLKPRPHYRQGERW